MRSQKSQKPAPKVTGSATDINGNTIYTVPSRTSDDVYQVVERDGHCQCFCRGYIYRGQCAHLQAVADYKRAQAKAANKDFETAAKLRDTAPLYRSNAAFSLFKQ